ncbi:hypothetical protein [Kribbella sp. NPDC023855]|uniref:hypothetical protein n=1 Tax=Kribbella sp. NPDC023855 TaxID=3154698 RepID=UPI0033EEA23B
MKPPTVARLAIAATICCSATGCFLAPSDPEGVNIGLRVDDGVVTLYVPLCPGEKVTAAYLDNPLGDGQRLWTGQGPTDPTSKVIRLGDPGWKKQSGSYRYDGTEIAVGVDGPDHSYGAGIIGKIPTDLPPGVYSVDSKTITGPELDQQPHC